MNVMGLRHIPAVAHARSRLDEKGRDEIFTELLCELLDFVIPNRSTLVVHGER